MNRFLSSLTLTAAAAVFAAPAFAQTSPLTVEVKAVTGVSTQGLTVELFGDESGWVFDPVKVNASGIARFSYVPEGVFTLTVDGSPLGLETYVDHNLQHSGEQTVTVTLNEAVRNPYALNATVNHDEFSGKNSVTLSWNQETDYFFDDFESYEPFSIDFAPWTGYDLDKEPAAEIQGGYPNRGTQQYATIFNPLTIDPPVYYEYEVLRPYSGKQCVGFVRTRSGAANNDWLISPKIKVGVNNIVSFMAKASEYQNDRFSVLISTTGTQISDFTSLTSGNYETVDYKAWKEIRYSLARYEGQEVYIAIHCVSQNGFMFMVDDFYVGPAAGPGKAKARRVSHRSAANPNEVFTVSLDGNAVGTTEELSYTIDNIASGPHTVGVKARYMIAESEETTLGVDVPGADAYASLTVTLTNDIDIPMEGQTVNILNTETARQTVAKAGADGKASVASLPKGKYMVNVASDIFDEYNTSIELDGDRTLEIALTETITDPYNLLYQVADGDGDTRDVELWWNQNLGFREGFEDYEDFTQKIGDWTVYDYDRMPTYAISIGGTLIVYPETRGEVGAMVFNPYSTRPVQASDDGFFLAPEGDKYAFFNSAEAAYSDDWLISPTQKIGRDYVLRFSAKSYDSTYAGLFEFCALRDKKTNSYDILDQFYLSSDWMRYEISLAAYEGESIEIGFHHTTYDGWISFIDDVYIGPSDESTEQDPSTARCTYDLYLDGTFSRNVSEPYARLAGLTAGRHTAGIQALYPSGKKSNLVEIEFTVDTSGVIEILPEGACTDWRYFDLRGIAVDPGNLAPGIYIRKTADRTEKVIIF